MTARKRTLTWTAAAAPGGGTRVILRGLLLGAVPRGLVRELRALRAASSSLLLDLSELDGADTPAVDTLRLSIAPLKRLRVLLPGDWAPIAHLLKAGLRGAVKFQDAPRRTRERREHHRYTTRVEVRISLADGVIVTGMTTDVSRGGLRATLARTSVHGGRRARRSDAKARETWTSGPLRIEIPALGLGWRAATIVGGDGADPRVVRAAFDEACADLFAA